MIDAPKAMQKEIILNVVIKEENHEQHTDFCSNIVTISLCPI